MKLLRQALDCQNPRSLWHRSICQCLYQAIGTIVAFVGVALGAFLLTAWATHFLLVALVPFLTLPAINLGLDDSNATLLRFKEQCEREGRQFLDWPVLVGADWIALWLTPFIVSSYYQWRGDWVRAGCALGLPLLLAPIAPTLIVFLFTFIASSFFIGIVGVSLDLFAWLSGNEQRAPFVLTNVLRTVVPLLREHTAPFYTLVGATGVLLGASIGLCLFLLLVVAVPLWALGRQCQRDVHETLHELDV